MKSKDPRIGQLKRLRAEIKALREQAIELSSKIRLDSALTKKAESDRATREWADKIKDHWDKLELIAKLKSEGMTIPEIARHINRPTHEVRRNLYEWFSREPGPIAELPVAIRNALSNAGCPMDSDKAIAWIDENADRLKKLRGIADLAIARIHAWVSRHRKL